MRDVATKTGDALRDRFMAWQCLIRQHTMRRDGGKPSDGMVPLVIKADGEELGHIRTVIAERDGEATTAQFRHTVQRTNDPRERFDKGIQYLSSAYFQKSRNFESRLFALFAPASPGATALLADRTCTLVFQQFNQSYRLVCKVDLLEKEDPFAQALFWHSAMFNQALPPDSMHLAFDPVWDESTAFPPVEGS